MKALLSAIVLSLVGRTVHAQTPTQVASTLTTSTTSAAATYTVHVGEGGFVFRPDVITAQVGDVIAFDFYPQNHSVVRAEYGFPCIPYEMTGPGKVGFFSYFRPVDAILDEPPRFSIQINDSNPIFYYCSGPIACIEKQMVGVINPNAFVSLTRQKQLAANASYMLNPGESFHGEEAPGKLTGTSGGATATSSPGTSSQSGDSDSSIPTGAVAGAVVGVVVVIAIAAGAFFLYGRQHANKKRDAVPSMVGSMTSGPASPGLPVRESVYGPGGTVYVPMKAEDFHNLILSQTPVVDYSHAPTPPLQIADPASPIEMFAPKSPLR